jgi:hypothetical protein
VHRRAQRRQLIDRTTKRRTGAVFGVPEVAKRKPALAFTRRFA